MVDVFAIVVVFVFEMMFAAGVLVFVMMFAAVAMLAMVGRIRAM